MSRSSHSTTDAGETPSSDDEWASSALAEAIDTLRTELESAEADASGAQAIALSRAHDLVDKVESTLQKTH